MENASKALIIAGSILVSIVIITLGVMIVNNVRETIQNNSNLSGQEVSSYNAEFDGYEGTRTGTQLKALLNVVAAHNRVQNDTSRLIMVEKDSEVSSTDLTDQWTKENANTKLKTAQGDVKAGYTYKVTMCYDNSSGLIIQIGYKRVTGSGTTPGSGE